MKLEKAFTGYLLNERFYVVVYFYVELCTRTQF